MLENVVKAFVNHCEYIRMKNFFNNEIENEVFNFFIVELLETFKSCDDGYESSTCTYDYWCDPTQFPSWGPHQVSDNFLKE